ncbi:hypothetical protein HYS97_02290 [Candidatus Daviesbacteria bacterium]|nr:hypothetical protein [Candidatus Daviesbacteria bacterium]
MLSPDVRANALKEHFEMETSARFRAALPGHYLSIYHAAVPVLGRNKFYGLLQQWCSEAATNPANDVYRRLTFTNQPWMLDELAKSSKTPFTEKLSDDPIKLGIQVAAVGEVFQKEYLFVVDEMPGYPSLYPNQPGDPYKSEWSPLYQNYADVIVASLVTDPYQQRRAMQLARIVHHYFSDSPNCRILPSPSEPDYNLAFLRAIRSPGVRSLADIQHITEAETYNSYVALLRAGD